MNDRDARSAGAAIPRDPPARSAAAPLPAQPDISPAFSAFYRQFVPTLVAFLIWQGARLPDAADIAQETMIKAYERWSKIDKPEAWARRVASRALVRRVASVAELPIDGHSSLPLTVSSVEAWEQQHEAIGNPSCRCTNPTSPAGYCSGGTYTLRYIRSIDSTSNSV